jgi:hypothetical protein
MAHPMLIKNYETAFSCEGDHLKNEIVFTS